MFNESSGQEISTINKHSATQTHVTFKSDYVRRSFLLHRSVIHFNFMLLYLFLVYIMRSGRLSSSKVPNKAYLLGIYVKFLRIFFFVHIKVHLLNPILINKIIIWRYPTSCSTVLWHMRQIVNQQIH